MAEHSIRAQGEQAGLVLESLLHLIKVFLDDDRSPSREVNARRQYSLHPRLSGFPYQPKTPRATPLEAERLTGQGAGTPDGLEWDLD
jgi:hypothetical protein